MILAGRVGLQYPQVRIDDYHIDAMAAHLVRRIHDFDVIVTTNMFGDILSDLAAELTGSLGIAPSINTNDHQAMAQAAHGSAPDIVGQNIANPTGMLLSVAMLMDRLASRYEDARLAMTARKIVQAIFETIAEGTLTRDLGGTASTASFSNAVCEKIRDGRLDSTLSQPNPSAADNASLNWKFE
ncbi:hypothetical protein GCM10020370_63580 [Paenibacillus hodogayensis]